MPKRKPFIHHYKWWVAWLAKAPNWVGDRYCLMVSEDKYDHDKLKFPMFYHYVEEDDSLWSISVEDTVKYRQWYIHDWHISKDKLTPEIITDEWREIINEYKYVHPSKEVPNGQLQPRVQEAS